jgi:hypothetical protein
MNMAAAGTLVSSIQVARSLHYTSRFDHSWMACPPYPFSSAIVIYHAPINCIACRVVFVAIGLVLLMMIG